MSDFLMIIVAALITTSVANAEVPTVKLKSPVKVKVTQPRGPANIHSRHYVC